MVMLSVLLAVPVSAKAIELPPTPEEALEMIPEEPKNFGEGLLELLNKAFLKVRPDLADAGRSALGAFSVVILVSLVESCSETSAKPADLFGAMCIAVLLLGNTRSLIGLADKTIQELSEYGKLLLPVMTAALAAQGGITASTALYVGTSAFHVFLAELLHSVMLPLVYLFLAGAVANCAIGEDTLKELKDQLKKGAEWVLKIIAAIFLSYLSLTGIISGTADAVALKAAKTAISAAVPVIGGTLANASESILVGAALVKNTAGISGIYVILALFLHPFLKIGSHYLVLKGTSLICGIFDAKRLSQLIGDFTAAMGLLLAMTGCMCLLLLTSMICFLKGGM